MEVTEIGGPIDTNYTHGTISNTSRVRVRRRTLNSVLEQCHRAIQLLNDTGFVDDDDDDDDQEYNNNADEDEFCSLLKSRVESPDFLEKLESSQVPVPQNMAEDCSTWDMVSEQDAWERGSLDLEEDYVLVRQEDIVDGIACFMAAYLLSLKETKPRHLHCRLTTLMARVSCQVENWRLIYPMTIFEELTPNQLQDALSKTFSLKKKKGKLRKAWDGSKLVYNVASWGATAIGIYQNPAILTAASAAFWTSCRVISKLF